MVFFSFNRILVRKTENAVFNSYGHHIHRENRIFIERRVVNLTFPRDYFSDSLQFDCFGETSDEEV